MGNEQMASDETALRSKEQRLFIFIIVFLFPLLSVAVVGGFGFAVWMYQLLVGHPGSPSLG